MEDISEKVLMGEFMIDPDFTEQLTEFIEKYEKMEKTSDMVLEKIFKNGMESLTELDKELIK